MTLEERRDNPCPLCGGLGKAVGTRGPITCKHCMGHGMVTKEDFECIHKWNEKQLGEFRYQWKCKLCPKVIYVDSSG